MSNLCYNCGDSHLPDPCPHPLNQCVLCGNSGHTLIFCPTGALRYNANHVYWMLCHNCDKWHMPEPCPLPMHYCVKCGHNGHLEVFCPVAPTIRAQLAEFMAKHNAVMTGSKRQRTDSHDSAHFYAVTMTQDNISTIRVATAKDVIELLKKGFDTRGVMEIMAKPIALEATPTLPPILASSLHGIGKLGGPNVGKAPSSEGLSSPYVSGFRPAAAPLAAKHADGEPPTPASDGHMPAFNSANESVYTAMHDRFGRGDFGSGLPTGGRVVNGLRMPSGAMTPTGGHRSSSSLQTAEELRPFTKPNPDVSSVVPSQPEATEEKPVKKRAAPRPRCPDCKASRRRCSHLVPDEPESTVTSSQTPAPVEDQTLADAPQQAEAQNGHYGNNGTAMQSTAAFGNVHAGQQTDHIGDQWAAFPAATHGNPIQREWLQNAVANMPDMVSANEATGKQMPPVPGAPNPTPVAQPAPQPQAQYGAITELENQAAATENAGSQGDGEKAKPKKRGPPKKRN